MELEEICLSAKYQPSSGHYIEHSIVQKLVLFKFWEVFFTFSTKTQEQLLYPEMCFEFNNLKNGLKKKSVSS
jgi:hypothetical protein